MKEWKPVYLHELNRINWTKKIYRHISGALHFLLFGAEHFQKDSIPYVYPEVVHPVTGGTRGGFSGDRKAQPQPPQPPHMYLDRESKTWKECGSKDSPDPIVKHPAEDQCEAAMTFFYGSKNMKMMEQDGKFRNPWLEIYKRKHNAQESPDDNAQESPDEASGSEDGPS